jgi:hypothetical protein
VWRRQANLWLGNGEAVRRARAQLQRRLRQSETARSRGGGSGLPQEQGIIDINGSKFPVMPGKFPVDCIEFPDKSRREFAQKSLQHRCFCSRNPAVHPLNCIFPC